LRPTQYTRFRKNRSLECRIGRLEGFGAVNGLEADMRSFRDSGEQRGDHEQGGYR
jgi:hypothetical protein